MKVAELSDFKVIVDNKYTYSQIKSYLKINGMVFEDLPKYLASNQEPITAVLTHLLMLIMLLDQNMKF